MIKAILLSASLLFLTTSQAPTAPDWKLSFSKKEIKAGDEVVITITTNNIAEGWYIYGTGFELEYGPMPATIEFKESDDVEIVGNLTSVDAVLHYDEVFEGDVIIFEKGKATFTQIVKAKKDNPVIKGTLNYQMCSQVSGICVMFDYNFSIGELK